MSETRFKFKKCELLPNEGSSLDEKYELLGGGPIVDYMRVLTVQLYQ